MFHRLDQITTGSLFILTDLPGAGKSHLAASTCSTGTLWLLDTEGAASTLRGKSGIHPQLQVVQTLSLRQLLDALRVIKRERQPGDTVMLDRISKVLQAMRVAMPMTKDVPYNVLNGAVAHDICTCDAPVRSPAPMDMGDVGGGRHQR